VGSISLEEGRLFMGDLVFWRGGSLPTTRGFITGVFYHPFYTLTIGFNDLVVIFKEVKFAWVPTAKKGALC
jgi:hypothetical protein